MGDQLPHGGDATATSNAESSIERVGLILELWDGTLEQHGGLSRCEGAHVRREFAVLRVSQCEGQLKPRD
jgi:hypothetical protein